MLGVVSDHGHGGSLGDAVLVVGAAALGAAQLDAALTRPLARDEGAAPGARPRVALQTHQGLVGCNQGTTFSNRQCSDAHLGVSGLEII